MKRNDFLKLTGISALGISTGLFTNPIYGFEKHYEKLEMPKNEKIKIVNKFENEEMWLGWLAKLTVSSLVSLLGAIIVEKYTDNCICDETTCYKSPSDYSNAVGIYGFNQSSNRFVRQTVNDKKVGFDNVSVPFLTKSNSRVGNVEGPFLAGVCWAINSLSDSSYSKETIKNVIMPTQMNQNGGYRFDTDPCYPTKYKTNYGSTEIQYAASNYGKGSVTVKARDKMDNLDWTETYDFNYA